MADIRPFRAFRYDLGKAGFDTFSKQLPVLRQARWPATDWLAPPYRSQADRMVGWVER